MSVIDPYAGLPANVPRASATAGEAVNRNTMGETPREVEQNFMRLLLAQLSNQDPLNPSDPAEMTAQLSQLNSVSSLQTLNANMKSMLDQVSAQAFIGASSLIGREVLIPGDTVTVGTGAPSMFGLRLPRDASQLVMSVVASDGSVVDEMALGSLRQGAHSFAWDGLGADGRALPVGDYRIVVSVDGGRMPEAEVLSGALVAALTRDGNQVIVKTTDGRTVSESDIQQLSGARTNP